MVGEELASEDRSKVKVFYESWFSWRRKRKPSYEYIVQWKRKRLRMAVKSLMCECSGNMVLDFGCGAGHLTQLLMKRFGTVVGVDISLSGLKIALDHSRQVKGDCNFVLADVFHLPFRRDCFDVVVMSEVIEHLDDQMQALKIIDNLLKSHGNLVLTTPNRFYRDVTWFIYRLASKKFDYDQVVESQLSPKGLRDIIKNFFKIEKEKGVYFSVPCVEKIAPKFVLPFRVWISEIFEDYDLLPRMAVHQCLLCSLKQG
jgi:ubiquinone/menaquinone biosynthesis C-methylase UbiE